MKKIFSFLFISGFIIGLAMLAQTVKAATANLILSPATDSYAIGEQFPVQVILSVDTQNVVDGIDIHYLHFDAAKLEIVSQTAGALCGPSSTLTDNFNNTAGWSDLSQVSGGTDYCSSAGVVMTINFRAKAAGVAVLSFDAAPGNGTDTNIASGGLDILTNASGASFTVNSGDAGAPTGCAIKINNDAAATNSVNVSLNISGCSDPNGMGQMKFSNTGVDGWSVAENYNESTPVSWTLSPDDAADKTVYAQFSDSLGIWTGNITDEIKLDTTAPINSSIAIVDDNGYVNNRIVVLEFYAEDFLSGMDKMIYCVAHQVQQGGGAGCFPESPYVTFKSATITEDEGIIIFSVKFSDKAGNWTDSVTAEIVLDLTLPTITHTPAINTVASMSTAGINWLTNENATAQAAYGLTDQYGNLSELDSSFDLAQTITLTGLESNKTYHYQLISLDQAGNEKRSADYTFQTSAVPDTTAPAAITLQVANDINNPETAVILTWTAPADDDTDSVSGSAAGYDIRYSIAEITADNFASANMAPGIPAPNDPGAAETFTVVGLARQSKYYFAAKATDEGPRWSILSNVPSLETLDKTAPSKIETLAADTLNITTNKIKLTWTAPGDDGVNGTATSYDVRYSTANIVSDADFNSAAQVAGEAVPKTAGSTEAIEIQNLSVNTTYYFAVKTVDDKGNWSLLSNIVSEKTKETPSPTDTTPPVPITDLNSSSQSANSITLTWIAPGDDAATGQASSYNIRYSTSNITDGNFVQAVAAPNASINPKIAGQTETFTVTGLSASTIYYFAIKTSDEAPNVSVLSNVISATTLTVATPPPPPPSPGSGPSYTPPSDTTAPAKPAEFKAVSSETQISFSWKNPKDTDFVRVKILRKDDKFSANSSDGQVIYEGNKESFIDKNLENKKTYYYAIFAYDGIPNWSQAETLKITASIGASAKPPIKEPNKIPLTDQKLEQPSTIKIEHKLKDKKPYVDLSWQNPASQEIKKINIWRSSILCQRDSLITTIDLTAKPLKQYSDQLPKDQEYFYILSSVNAAGQESKAVIQWSSQSGKIVGYLTKFTAVDRDCDGLQDKRERLYKSDSQKADTDGDGYLDGLEIEIGFNPTVKAESKIWDSSLSKRLKGKILLAPQFYGESYYVHPDNQKAYFLNRPADAFAIMRSHGLGITNANLAKIPKKDEEAEGDIKLRQRLAGKILLQVEEKGEAWYIYPDNLKRYYLGRPADAFAIMRSLSLGISNENLIKFDLQL